MKLINIPFLLITISLIFGIIVGYYIEIDQRIIFSVLGLAITLLALSWFKARKRLQYTPTFSIFCVLIFTTIGITLVHVHNPKNQKNHYLNLIQYDQMVDEKSQDSDIQFAFRERLKPTQFYNKYVVNVEILNKKKASGKILLLLPKNTTKNLPKIGEKWIANGKLKPISKPLNPDQFDYANFLAKQYVYYQFTPTPGYLKKIGIQKSIYGFADRIRSNIIEKLSHHTFNTKQLSIIKALLLGQRQDIDQDILKDYRDAGAIHILAVSGLHIGVLMFIFNFLLKPLNQLKRKGKIIKTVLVILLLWTFAILAGLSPSILRAATMFSFLLVGLQFRSKVSTYNSLFASLFILLCFQPLLLFSVGFQLSYIAVFAIIWIQPLLAQYYVPRFKFDKIIWETFTVTIAAQLGLLPLTLFYFHQFPLLFFIANLLIIPVLGFILGTGILVIILAAIEFLPSFLVKLFGSCIDIINTIVHWSAAQEDFLISNITFSWRLLITSYILIILSVFTVQKFNIKKLFAMGCTLIVFLTIIIVERKFQFAKEELIVFHNPGNTILGVQRNQTLQVYTKDSISTKTNNYLFTSYLIENNSEFVAVETLSNVYKYQEKIVFIIDESGIYNLDSFYPDILLLSGGPKIHLGKVIKELRPKQIIADGSNWKNYLDRWEATCRKQNIPFYRTDTSGAYIFTK